MPTARNQQTDLVGQDQARNVLTCLSARHEWPSLLLTGQAGVGKRTAALLLSRAVNCAVSSSQAGTSRGDCWLWAGCGDCSSCRSIAALTHPDIRVLLPIKLPRSEELDPCEVGQLLLETCQDFALGRPQPFVDPRLRIPIDAIRWLRTETARPPLSARRRFYIILHAHRLTAEAANALLKTLEEPQAQTTFVLTTDSPSCLLDTIRSRCQRVRFADLQEKDITHWLMKRNGAAADEAARAASLAGGSIGAAVRTLHRRGDTIPEPAVRYFETQRELDEKAITDAVAALDGFPLSSVVDAFLLLHRETMRIKLGLGSAPATSIPAIRKKARSSSIDYLLRATRYLLSRSEESRFYVNPRLSLYTLLAALRAPS